MQELKDLTEMKEKGLIDDDEFKQMKKEILGQNGQQGGVVKVSQPISSSQLLPPGGMVMPPPPQMQQGAPQMQSPDFNSMYEQNPTPLENAAVPQFEPMAANEGMGGFSSW